MKLERRELEKTRDAVLTAEGKVWESDRQRGFHYRKGDIKLRRKDRKKLVNHPEQSYVITMMFGNGTLKTWVVKTASDTFEVNKKMYNIVYEEAWFDLSMKQYHLFYYEGIPTNINREIEMHGDEAFFKVKPESLKPLIRYKYIDALVRSASLPKWFIWALWGAGGLLAVFVIWYLFAPK